MIYYFLLSLVKRFPIVCDPIENYIWCRFLYRVRAPIHHQLEIGTISATIRVHHFS